MRERHKKRLIRETRDTVELKMLKLARRIRFDEQYIWKCRYCNYKTECDSVLETELNILPKEHRWRIIGIILMSHRSQEYMVEKPFKRSKNTEFKVMRRHRLV